MNRYRIHLESQDERVFEVVVKADGLTERMETVIFWRWRMWPFWRVVHVVAKANLISIVGEPYNS